jgi:hypothetical protein
MKTLEILLRLIDKLLASLAFRKAQDARNKLEESPSDWFAKHFNSSMFPETTSKTDKTNSADK